MTNEKSVVEETKPANAMDKLASLFNEEIYVRTDVNSIPASRFKIYDDLIDFYEGQGLLDEAKEKVQEHFSEHPDSISSRYILGMIALRRDEIVESSYLRNLLEQFRGASKWAIIEYITDNILKYGEQRFALRFKAEALEKLKKNKELKQILEKLVKHDKKNPEITKKYALSILDEDKEKALSFLQQAAAAFAKNKEYEQLEEVWPILVQNKPEDMAFWEKIERELVGHREKTRLVGYLYPLVEPYKTLEDWDKVIALLKKILDYEPQSNKARNELIRAYKTKYEGHSLLDDFLKMSELGNNRKPVNLCIANFERNIVFDTNNYVHHRNWGVGKITSISSQGDFILVDFADKKDHRLSIQMAITSLKPLKRDHIWVDFYENEADVKELFSTDVEGFLQKLLSSFDNRMLTSEIKAEVTAKYLPLAEWAKWWTKAKTVIKKNDKLGFNPKKKDELLLRETQISFAEELQEQFNAQSDFNKRLDIAMKALKNGDDAENAIHTFLNYYRDEDKVADPLRRIVAFLFIQETLSDSSDEEDIREIEQRKKKITDLIRSLGTQDLLEISSKINNVDVKKNYVDLLSEIHPEHAAILVGLLYEVPVKVNKYAFGQLVTEQKYDELNNFISNVSKKNKEHPEVFLWVAKSILTEAWDYSWLKVDRLDLILRVFRLLKPLAKIEDKGTKLKNACSDILFSNDNAVLTEAVEKGDNDYVRKLYALYKEVPYISDAEKDKLKSFMQGLKADLDWDDGLSEEEEDDYLSMIPENGVLVTRWAFNHKKNEFDHLVNVEMVANSRDIGEAQERGDLRENAEYKAAMERQSQLQAEIKKLEKELKSAVILNLAEVKTDRINIGCAVKLRNKANGEDVKYSILGAWDADTEKSIISYQSPLAKSLLGKRVGDEATLSFSSEETVYEVLEITRYAP